MKIYVKPRFEGAKVPLEAHEQAIDGLFLPAEGREVEPNSYWHRRLRDSFPGAEDSDVVLCEAPAAVVEDAPEEEPEEEPEPAAESAPAVLPNALILSPIASDDSADDAQNGGDA